MFSGGSQHAEFIFEIRFHSRGREMGQPEIHPPSRCVTLCVTLCEGGGGSVSHARSTVYGLDRGHFSCVIGVFLRILGAF